VIGSQNILKNYLNISTYILYSYEFFYKEKGLIIGFNQTKKDYFSSCDNKLCKFVFQPSYIEFMKKQADRLRLIRVSKGMSQENVAKALDITVGAYSKIERGVTKLSLNRLDDLSKIFDIELNDFIRYLNGESDSLDRKLNIPGAGGQTNFGNQNAPVDSEVALLRKIINLYDESKELNTKAVIRNIFEGNNVNVPSFIDVLKESSNTLSSKKLDANQITNYNKGIERIVELLG
jgi:transcriptional regulator with XRE-family HTH domain